MENFDWTKFTRKIAVKAKLSDMYDAWTKASEIEKWFLSDARFFDSDNNPVSKEVPIKEGYSYDWSWYLYDLVEKGKITKANGKDHLQFTFAGDCLVDIQLTQHEHYVIVELTQKNIPTDDVSKQNIRLGCDTGWSFYLVNLKSFYEGGIDLRNKNEAITGTVNM